MRLEDICVVQNFSDLFLKDLPKLPLEIEIDLIVDLVLDVDRILLPLYWIAIAELKMLKTQF